MTEAAADANEELMENIWKNGELSNQEIRQGLRQLTLQNRIVPALCGSAFKNKGVQAMLDAIIDYLPSPNEVMAIKGVLADEATELNVLLMIISRSLH
jgi:elongation factor G